MAPVNEVPAPSIERACYWLANRPPREVEALSGDWKADITIVGGGFTGLWTALALKELDPSLEVAVLEQGIVGYGASGRNAGIVGETLDHSHELAAAHFGEDEARDLARLGRENLDELERFLRERGIDAEFDRPGQLVMALTPAHEGELQDSVAFAHRLGLTDWRYLSAAEARAEIGSPLYRGAALAPRSGTIHPMKLVEGQRAEAARAGVRIFERTPVDRLSRSGRWMTASARGGRVRSEKIILATNAYTHHLRPRLLRRFLPLYDYIIVSDPLTSRQRDAIGWRRRQGVTDARAFFNYYRLTADDRVLFGTSEAVYYRGNRVDPGCDDSPAHSESLRASFRRHFPDLAGLRFPYAWGGPICSTTRLTPFFGRAAGGGILYGLGYTGHGIATTRIAGKILALMALARRDPLLDLAMVRRPPFPYPPEPLRNFAVGRVTRALRRVDAGERPGMLLRLLDAFGIGFSS